MSSPEIRCFFAARALLAQGWGREVLFAVGRDGRIARIATGASPPPGCAVARGPVVPALANLHSHAFQRAMAGLAEVSGEGEDSFWTWRDTMYRLVARLTPDALEAVATRLYVDMLKAGYGSVAEFHYVHHAPDGGAYADPAEMSRRILAAARTSGIGLTLLPVFYAHGNFGGTPAGAGQRRFLHDVDGFLTLLGRLGAAVTVAGARLGIAIHSLRAATPDEIRAILSADPTSGPLHIHIAEQQREVDDCLAWSGRRPIAWLFDSMPVDERWCLVHATHSDPNEIARIAASGAVVGLCPTTEASLGDGVFDAARFFRLGGRFGVGSDSHVAVSPAEELRLLEYGQRLRDQRRVRLVEGPGRSNGRALFDAARAGGAQALGGDGAGLAEGAPADLLVLDEADAFIAAAEGDAILDRWMFALGDRVVRDVMVAGEWVIRERHHARDEAIDAAYRDAVAALAG